MSGGVLCAIYVHFCHCWCEQLSCALCTFVHDCIQVHAWFNNFVCTVITCRLNCWSIVHNFLKRAGCDCVKNSRKTRASSRRKNSLEKLIDIKGSPGTQYWPCIVFCLAYSVSHSSVKQQHTQHIKKNKVVMQPSSRPVIPPLAPLCFHPFVMSILSGCCSPTTTLLQKHS